MNKRTLTVGVMLIWWGLFAMCFSPALAKQVNLNPQVTTGMTGGPVLIKINDVASGQVLVEPVMPALFMGSIEGDVRKGEMLRCQVGSKALGTTYLDGKGHSIPVTQVELTCGDKKILLTGVSFN